MNNYRPGVLSVFDGIACCRIALDHVGILPYYFASELEYIETPSGVLIPNPAVKIAKRNYPDITHIGDVTKVDGNEYKDIIDLLAGGSPCQSFSNAGERTGFDGKSGLFWEFVRLKNEINPQFFFLENVVMKDKWLHKISDALGRDPFIINSKVASAQTRPRAYWTNIPYTPIEDECITLGDVILGAVTGTGKHGHKNPLYGVIPGEKKWKNIGWQDNTENKAYCVVRAGGHYKNTQGVAKRFTPEDCEVLQTIPIGYTDVYGVSNTARIEAIGNAWTVDVIVKAFFKNLPWTNKMKVQTISKIKIL